MSRYSLPSGVYLAFCPTGKGGGKDNSCAPANKLSGIERKRYRELRSKKILNKEELNELSGLNQRERIAKELPPQSLDALIKALEKLGVKIKDKPEAVVAKKLPIEAARDKSSAAPPRITNTDSLDVSKPWTPTAGMTLYHASGEPIDKVRDTPMWFTPNLKEAKGYHNNTIENVGEGFSYEMTLNADKFATQDQAEEIAKPIFGEDYSWTYAMLDPAVGEHEPKQVKAYIKALDAAGFDGVIHSDYSAVDQNKDAYTAFVFHPNKTMSKPKLSTKIME